MEPWALEPEERGKLRALLEEPGWTLVHLLVVSLLQEYNSRLLSSRDLLEVGRAQGAYEALIRLQNTIIDETKEE